jgi:DNA-binding CsgD family transcriptional regulator
MASGVVHDFSDCIGGDRVLAELKLCAIAMGFDAVVIADLQPGAQTGATSVRWSSPADRNVPGRTPGDAACQAARRRVAPFLWPDLHLGRNGIDSLALLRLSIPDLDPACVGTIPVHGPGGSMACLHVAARCTPAAFASLFHQRAHDLQAMAIEAAQRLIELGVEEAMGKPLTDRQMDVLHWVVQGKTNWEIGQILGISSDTVRQHVMHIAGVLKVRNRVQVAATAVARGICAPSSAIH